MQTPIRHTRPRKSKNQKGKKFWEKEYRPGKGKEQHLALSINPSEDLVKFTRWLLRETGHQYLKPVASVLDIGCGNGRNSIYLSEEFGMHGVGYDISSEAISQAKKRTSAKNLPLDFFVKDMKGHIPLPDASQTLVLDMMSSHFLNAEERNNILSEIVRVLRPDGWLFFKTFLLDEDEHAKRLLRDHPAGEPGSYIHPEIGVPEHVYTEQEIEETLGPHFILHKILPSHRHLKNGRPWKRRSVSVYAQRRENQR